MAAADLFVQGRVEAAVVEEGWALGPRHTEALGELSARRRRVEGDFEPARGSPALGAEHVGRVFEPPRPPEAASTTYSEPEFTSVIAPPM
jgi:hypothetical protein